MIICRVIGNIVSTRKHEQLKGTKLLIVQPVLGEKKEPMVAVDDIGAGIGETVLIALGCAARIATGKDNAPIDVAVVGIVDNADSIEI